MGLKRRPPGDDTRRVRAIDGNIRGVITNKVGRIVQYESFAERSLLLRLDRARAIQDYASQPETLIYTTPDSKCHTYTPDFKIWKTHHQVEIHEVTCSERLSRPNQQSRMQAAQAICHERGWLYVVHTEKDLPQGTELSNLLILMAYRPKVYRDALLQEWLENEPKQTMPLGDLISEIEQRLFKSVGQLLTGLYHEIWHGRIDMNWEELLLRGGCTNKSMPITYGGKR